MRFGGFGRGAGRGSGRGGRQGGAKAAGPAGYCVCPQCGHRQKHQLNQPCYKLTCSKCGTQLVRE